MLLERRRLRIDEVCNRKKACLKVIELAVLDAAAKEYLAGDLPSVPSLRLGLFQHGIDVEVFKSRVETNSAGSAGDRERVPHCQDGLVHYCSSGNSCCWSCRMSSFRLSYSSSGMRS